MAAPGASSPSAAAAAAAATIAKVFRGTFFHSTRDAALVVLKDALLGVDSAGKVCGVT